MILEFYEKNNVNCKKVEKVLSKFPNIPVFKIDIRDEKSLPLIDLHSICMVPTLVFLPSLYTLYGDISQKDILKAINRN